MAAGPRTDVVRLGAILCAVALLAASIVPAFAQEEESPAPEPPPPPAPTRPGREVSLPPDQVRDTFFAYVLGIVMTGIEVDIDNSQMREILTEFKSKLNVPFDLITRVTQHTDEASGERTISLEFNGDVVIPIPFSILGYHPGTVRSTQQVDFRVTRAAYNDQKDPRNSTLVYDLALSGGSVLIDVDDWIVYILGTVFDKIQIRHIVFFRYDDKWIGLLEGKGKVFGRSMREYFDFTHNGIVFPVPTNLDLLGAGVVSGSAFTNTAATSTTH